MITASKLRKLKKDKKKLFNTVVIAADTLSETKREQGRREGMLAMVAAMNFVHHFGPERLNRVLAQANVILKDMEAPGVVETMTTAWEQKGVKV